MIRRIITWYVLLYLPIPIAYSVISLKVIDDPKMLMVILVEKIALNKDDVAVVVALRREKPNRRCGRNGS